ncbi:Hypothetical protein A7982_02414 [Minicystis rosea]|nr:Hypothetical protein A7982_02414 [Minicystis rosea]
MVETATRPEHPGWPADDGGGSEVSTSAVERGPGESRAAVKAGATVGEISDVLRRVRGEHRETLTL